MPPSMKVTPLAEDAAGCVCGTVAVLTRHVGEGGISVPPIELWVDKTTTVKRGLRIGISDQMYNDAVRELAGLSWSIDKTH